MRIRVFPSESELARAHRLRAVSFGTLGVVAVAFAVLMALEPSAAVRRLVSLAGVAALIGIIHEVNRRGRTTVASWLFVLGLIVIATERAWITGGISAPILPLYVLFVLMGGVLLSRLGGLLTAVMCGAGAVVLTIGQITGAIPPVRTAASPIGTLIFLMMILALALVLQWMIGHTFRDALARADREIAVRRATETRLDLAMTAAKIAVWELDRDHRRLTGDARLGAMYDLTMSTEGTAPLDELLARIHPDDLPSVLARAETVRAGSGTAEHSHRVIRPDGSIRYVRGASTAVPETPGHPARIVGATMDVTENALADIDRARLVHDLGERVKELQLLHGAAVASQRPWRSTRDLLSHVVGLMPPAWQYPECTEARIALGDVEVATPGWMPTPWMQSVPLTVDGHAGAIEVAYTAERPAASEGPFLKEERDLLVSLAEMLAAILTSQRTRRELEQLVETRTGELRAARDAAEQASHDLADNLKQLRALERVRDDLVQMIIHDMRGLLTVVIANLELAQPELDGQPAADVSAALGAAEAIARMASTVLDTSRLREGKMPVRRASVDVAGIAAGAARTFGALDASRAIRCAGDAPAIATCDADLIRRVIENLVGNALKHTPSGATIVIAVRAEERRLHVSIVDDGPGVPEDVRTTLFDKFATSSKGSKYHSAGLGLAFCRLAVEAHGGSIGVEPAVPAGSNFWFSIPI